MGTWGTGPFDDDGASDWVWELQEATDWAVVEQALRGAADVSGSSYLEAPDGQIAWAGAAVVAAALPSPAVAVTPEVAEWLSTHAEELPTDLRPLALRAVQRVMAANSELAELWAEAGEDEWRSNMETLAAALAGDQSP
jgi:Domain of unknown function (DUF4259)